MASGQPGINGTRVFFGGLLAGLVMNGIDWATNTYWLARDWAVTMHDRNIEALDVSGTESFIKFFALDIAFGLIAVFTYAAMRPRFGAGPTTAVAAGVSLFLFLALSNLGLQMSGFFSMDMYLKASAAELVSILAGTFAGAWLYKEREYYA